MKIFPKPVTFEWDKGNIDKNFKKHSVANKEAEEVFENKPSFIIEDEKHSLMEKRYMIWGETDAGRKLSVFFTVRKDKMSKALLRIRIISARDMNKKERKAYKQSLKF